MKPLMVIMTVVGLLLATTAALAQQQSGTLMAQGEPGRFVVYFALGKSTLDARALATISDAVQEYQRTGSARISVRGHTDTSGSAAFNQALSERREQAVADELIRLGVPADAITGEALGETQLAIPTADGVREAENRRVDIEVEQPPAAREPVPAPAPAPVAVATEESPWSFGVTSYVWFAGLSGDVGAGGQVADIDVDFSEIFDAIDWFPPPVMFVGEVRYGRFGFFTDFIYMGLEGDGEGPGGLLSAELDMQAVVWTFGGAYRVIQEDPVTLDLLAGGRLWNLDAEVTIAGPGGALQGSGSETWVDPIIGVAGRVKLGERFALQAEGDVGGFGVASDLDWQVLGTLQYQLNDSITLEAGYRYLAVDYDDGGFLFDVAMHGPIIGGSFRF